MAKEISIHWVEGNAWRAETRGHAVVADILPSAGEESLGMTPGELMVAAMGLCMSLNLSYYSMRHPGIDLSQVRVELTWEDAPDLPSRIGVIRGRVILPDTLSKQERKAILPVLESCKVSRTLRRGLEIDLEIEYEIAAPTA